MIQIYRVYKWQLFGFFFFISICTLIKAQYAPNYQFENLDYNKTNITQSEPSGEINSKNITSKHEAVMNLLYSYRSQGHSKADLDPLNIQKRPIN